VLLPIKNFLGLRTGVSDPEVGGAGVASNFRRNRVRGQLELADGYATRLGFNPTTWGVTNLVPIAHKQFYIADQGGRTITLVYANYTKAIYWGTGLTLNTSGIFIRPFYDGIQWQDDWQELTEFEGLEKSSVTGAIITFDNSPAIPGFESNHFAGWVLSVDGGWWKITASSGVTATVVGDAADFSGGTVYMVLQRNMINGISQNVLPSMGAGIYPHIRGLLDEVRITTGNGATDMDLAVFYRDKSMLSGIGMITKGTHVEYGQLNFPSASVKLLTPTVVTTDAGLPQGVYTIKASIVTDDGQETALRDVITGSFTNTSPNISLGANTLGEICTDGAEVYVASSNASGDNYLWRLNTDGVIQATVTIAEADGIPVAIRVNYGVLCVVLTDASNNRIRASKYNASSLLLVEHGTWVTVYTGWGQLRAAITEDSAFACVSDSGLGNHKLHKISLATLASADTSDEISDTYAPHSVIANGDYVLVTGDSHLYLFETLDIQTPTDLYDGYATEFGCTVGLNFYISTDAGTKIRLVASVTGVITSVVASGPTDIRCIFPSGGTLYVKDGANVTNFTTAGVEVSDFTDPSTDLTREIVLVGTRVFGLSDAFYFRIYGTVTTGAIFIGDGKSIPQFDLAVSPAISRRAAYVNVYISKDDGAYYLAKEYNILNGGEPFETATVWNATVSNRYYVSLAKTITRADYDAMTETAIGRLGRLTTDTGILPYSHALVANNTTYAIGVSVGGRIVRNKIYTSPVSTDGVPQYDVLPNDVTTILDCEFNDGDQILALGNVADRILALKSRSLVLLTPNADGSHSRDVVSTGVGIAAVRSLVAYNESLYWLDHSGVWQFNTAGLKKMSTAIDDILFDLTDAQRSAAIACVDPKYTQYRVLVNGVVYACDLVDGEWTMEDGADQIWFDSDLGFGSGAGTGSNAPSSRRYTQLVTAGIQVPVEDTLADTSTWETSRIELPVGDGFDALLSALTVQYSATGTPVVTIGLYLNDSPTAVKSFTLPVGPYEVTIPAPLAARCKWFRLRLTVGSTAGDTVKIRRMGAYFNQIPIGGDHWIVRADASPSSGSVGGVGSGGVVPAYYEFYGDPPTSLGKDGDTGWDLTGMMRWFRSDGAWRQ